MPDYTRQINWFSRRQVIRTILNEPDCPEAIKVHMRAALADDKSYCYHSVRKKDRAKRPEWDGMTQEQWNTMHDYNVSVMHKYLKDGDRLPPSLAQDFVDSGLPLPDIRLRGGGPLAKLRRRYPN